jgi:hypothetical protein
MSTPEKPPEDNPPSSVTITLSLSLSSSSFPRAPVSVAAPLDVIITARITASSRPSSPITLNAFSSLLQPNLDPEAFDAFNLDYLRLYREDPVFKPVSLGAFWPHWGYDDLPAHADVRQRNVFELITIPSMDSGEAFEVRHVLSWERIVENTSLDEDAVAAGENWSVSITDRAMRPGWHWWTWGDVRDGGDLKDKLLLGWRKDDYNKGEPEPTRELLDGGAVVGEKSAGLKVEYETKKEVFTIV